MGTLTNDLRYACRWLVRNPGFSAVAVVSLAIGIGANTAVFSIVDKLLVRSLPVAAPKNLVSISAESVNPKFLNNIFSYPDYVDYRDKNEVLSGLIASAQIDGRVGTGDDTDRVSIEMVSGNYFDVLGAGTALGRTFLPEEDQTPGTHPVAVLSYGTWQRRFGAAADVLGKTVTLNNAGYTVIGVARKGFSGTRLERPTEVWVPLMMRPQLMPGTASLLQRRLMWLRLMGRLGPGVTIEQARESLDALARQVREANTPASDWNLPFAEKRVLLEPGGKGISFLRGKLDKTLTLLMVVVGLLLLIACANVATLLLARSTARRKEIAVRLALGASRARIVKQLLTESLLLAMVGASVGLLVAPWLSDLLLAFQPNVNIAQTPLAETLDARVLGFTLLVSVFSGAIFGVVPGLQISTPDLVPALKNSASVNRRERRLNLRNLLVIAQVALALVVLIGAGLLIKSLRNLFSIDPGFSTENVLLVPIELPRERSAGGASTKFFTQLSERLRTLPGVEAVSTASITPLSGSVGTMSVLVEGYQANQNENLGVDYNEVGPGYHELMGMRLVEGRGFTDQDRAGAPGVVVINEAMARLFFQNQSAIGKRISAGPGNPWLEVIGIARDFKIRSLTETPVPHFDLPSLQGSYGSFARVLIRARTDASRLLPVVRQEVKALDPSASIVGGGTTLSAELSNSIAPARMATALTGLFGLVALVLATIGLYGVMAYLVSCRTREIGVRMALGAERSDVLTLVLRKGMALVAPGIVLGLASAFAASRLISAQLYGVSATDPATFALIASLLTTIALLACYIPARRATKVDPMVALRYE